RRDGRRTAQRRGHPDRVLPVARPARRHPTNRNVAMNGHHDSPLVRFLRDPGRALAQTLHALAQHAAPALPFAVALAALALVLLLAAIVLARVRERRLARGARLLQLAVAPQVEPAGALLLWAALHDLLRPRLARLLAGQPQLAWEIAADHGGSRFRLWIPAAVPPGLV